MSWRRGSSLVELLIALMVLQVVGAAALATALMATRLSSRATRGMATDRQRRAAIREAAAAPACRAMSPPGPMSLTLPATAERPMLVARLWCGGTSLVELLVALTLLGLVGVLAATILTGVLRPLRALSAAAAASRTVLGLEGLLGWEAAAPGGLRLAASGPATLDFDRHVGDGALCAIVGTAVALDLSTWVGERLPDAERDAIRVRDDTGAWHAATPQSASAGTCPTGVRALWLTLDRAVTPGWAVIEEPSRVLAYDGTGGRWLGLAPRRTTTAVQPFAGPLGSPGLAVVPSGQGVRAEVTPREARAIMLEFAVSTP